MQIENEYGFCPLAPDAKYLSFLKDRIHQYLGKDTIIYTTDPPSVIDKGTIFGRDVYSCAPSEYTNLAINYVSNASY